MIKETATELALALHMQRSRDISYLLKDIQELQKQVDAMHSDIIAAQDKRLDTLQHES